MWHEALDFYCERTSVGFWDEPLNAISNLSFVLSACYGYYYALQTKSRWLWWLALLAMSVGIGSFLFHTFATRWSHLADIIPIGLLISSFVAYVMRRFYAYSKTASMAIAVLFIVLSILIELFQPRHLLNGSLGYSHAVVMLIFFSISLRSKDFVLATFVFIISLLFRTLDHELCSIIPIGTHFLWHLFNGIMIWIILNIVIKRENKL